MKVKMNLSKEEANIMSSSWPSKPSIGRRNILNATLSNKAIKISHRRGKTITVELFRWGSYNIKIPSQASMQPTKAREET